MSTSSVMRMAWLSCEYHCHAERVSLQRTCEGSLSTGSVGDYVKSDLGVGGAVKKLHRPVRP